jgi:hypothetical protein
MPKRSLGDEVASRVKARAIVVPFVAKISPMVDRAIFLETVASRRRGRRPDLRHEAEVLAKEAREDLYHLDKELALLPEKVSGNSRLADLRRALVGVLHRFEHARSIL